MTGPILYLYDDAAVDVSRITGIPWSWQQLETGGTRRPFLDLMELDWWDRMRVAFTVIAVECLLASYFTRDQDGTNGRANRMDSGVDNSGGDQSGAWG